MRARYVSWSGGARGFLALGLFIQSLSMGHTVVDTVACSVSNLHLLRGQSRREGRSIITGRGARDYATTFGTRFQEKYLTLGPDDVILDMGDGQGRFGIEMTGTTAPDTYDVVRTELLQIPQVKQQVKQAFQFIDRVMAVPPAKRPSVVGFNYADGHPKSVSHNRGRYRQVRGLFESLPEDLLVRGRVGVEIWGVLAYTNRLSETAEKAFERYDVGSELFLEIDSSEHTTLAHTKIRLRNGQSVSLLTFMKAHVPGISVETYSTYSVDREHLIAHVKVTGPVRFPKLRLVAEQSNFDYGPPDRTFEEID